MTRETEAALIQRAERIERLEGALKEALEVIDKLIDSLNDYYEANEGSRWVDQEGNPKPLRDWMHLKGFGEDHELYDALMALWGAWGVRGRKIQERR